MLPVVWRNLKWFILFCYFFLFKRSTLAKIWGGLQPPQLPRFLRAWIYGNFSISNRLNQIFVIVYMMLEPIQLFKKILWSVIERQTGSTTNTTSGQTNGQTSTTSGQTNEKTSTTSGQTSTTRRQRSIKSRRRVLRVTR